MICDPNRNGNDRNRGYGRIKCELGGIKFVAGYDAHVEPKHAEHDVFRIVVVGDGPQQDDQQMINALDFRCDPDKPESIAMLVTSLASALLYACFQQGTIEPIVAMQNMQATWDITSEEDGAVWHGGTKKEPDEE